VAHVPHGWYALDEWEDGVKQLCIVEACDYFLNVVMRFYIGITSALIEGSCGIPLNP